MMNDNKDLFCNTFRNKNYVNELKLLKNDYIKFIETNIIKNDENEIIKIYNEFSDTNVNSCVIDYDVDDISDILDKYEKSEFNNKYNKLFLHNYSGELKKNNIKSDIYYCGEEFDKTLKKVLKNLI